MRAGWFERTGPAADVIEIGERTTPTPAAGEVMIRLHASGVNPSDYKRRGNLNVPIEFPRVIPHSDGAGVVAGLGAGVRGFAEGDRVWCYNAQWARPDGTAAEFVVLPTRRVKPLPASASFEEGACFGIPAMTGYRATHVAGALGGKTVYVPGATGRVGAYAVQFAKWRGARVIASTGGGDDARKAVSALGADIVLDRTHDDIAGRIFQETAGRGVDLVVDVDLPNAIKLDEAIVAENGAVVSFGAASAPSITIATGGRKARNFSLHMIFVYLLDEPTFESTCAGIDEAQRAGALAHRIAGVFPLAELARAHAFAESTSGAGHVVVEI